MPKAFKCDSVEHLLSDYCVETCDIKQFDEIKAQWLALQQRSDCSYFKSWGWIGVWLKQVAVEFHPHVIRVWLGDSLVGIGLFVYLDITRHLIIHSKAMCLNDIPFGDNDMVIEYNGMLVAKGHEAVVYKKTIDFLLEQYPSVDEFHFGAVASEPDSKLLKECAQAKLKYIVDEQSACWHVDLEKLKPGLDAYLASLSRNSRGQIRRSLRLYEDYAPVTLIEAETTKVALEFFKSLQCFHTKRWQLKGEVGAFSNAKWVSFHSRLIQERFKYGEIQMIKIANSYDDIAFLFNYVWQRKVYVLQMGFNYSEDRRYKPGYLAHALAIVHNKEKGMVVYDFMHGDARYKKSLGSGGTRLHWVVMQRARFKFSFERLMVGVVRRWR